MAIDPFSPRKVAQQSRARETIEDILQASAQIVSRHGLERLTTNHIAERAGVSVGSLYQYFPGKDAVLHAVIEREFNRAVDAIVAQIDSTCAKTVPLDEAIAGLVRRVFELNVRNRPFLRQLVLAAVSLKHLRFTLANDVRVLAALRAKLAEYGDEVDAEELELATFVALYALKGVQIGTVFADHSHDEAKMRALLVRMLRALVERPRAAS